MISETDSPDGDALQQLQQFMSVLDDDQHRRSTESFTATDEAETVTVVVNGDRWLTGLRIQHGLLRLGADTVKHRINEALQKAQAAALDAGDAEDVAIEDSLAAMLGTLQQQFGDLPTA
jgi:DNA-binding protein YbaB